MILCSRIHFALLAVATSSMALELSGRVILLDGSPKKGVTVRLSGTGDSTVTDPTGHWQLGATEAIRGRFHGRSIASTRIEQRNGRLVLVFGGNDVLGRGGAVSDAVGLMDVRSAARPTVAMDSLVYEFQGRRFLRDTVSASRSGMIRIYDTTWNEDVVYGYLVDERDGIQYRTVRIGSQTWMAQNLNYRGEGKDSGWVYENKSDSGLKYGRYYRWNSVVGLPDSCATTACASSAAFPVRGICPTGWHVPSEVEWTRLTDTLLIAASSGSILQARFGWGWSGSDKGTDSLGFRALPGGYMDGEKSMFYARGTFGKWWSSHEKDATRARNRSMYAADPKVTAEQYEKKYGLFLRCLAD